MGLLFLGAVIGFIATGAVYQARGRSRDLKRFLPPGSLVSLSDGSTRLHAHQLGSGKPIVVFEAGIAASSVSWCLVQPEVSKSTRTLSYDRAGLGWSSDAWRPPRIQQSIDELRELLQCLGLTPPYVLVGHSYGGLLMCAYASRFPGEVQGLLLIDPASEVTWATPAVQHHRRLRKAVLLSRQGSWLAWTGLVRLALENVISSSGRPPKWLLLLTGGDRDGVAARLAAEVAKMPRAHRAVVRAHWSNPRAFRAMAAYLGQLPATSKAVAGLKLASATPVVVISAASATAAEIAEREQLCRNSTAGRHIVAEDSGHWIPFDQPELIIEEIRRLLNR